ncbi:MAG: AMP-binding protein, partial [Alphaproteobacteria bacterium]|nr:AMP-binding protein [Alphaproteobacteria bacterium]
MSANLSAEGAMNAADALLDPPLRAAPDTPAILAGDRVVSYPELAAAAARAGHALRGQGLGRQDRVVLLVDDRPEFFFAYIGALKIGAVPIAVNLRLSVEELAYILDDSGAKLLIADPEFLDLAQEAAGTAQTDPPILLTGPGGGFA